MLPSRYFIDLTQPEIAAQFRKNPLVILPAGSVEQHGPHLPTGTDIYASNVIGHAVAERMDGLVLPGGPLGVTPMHMPFEGTITLTPETYQRVVVESCESTASITRRTTRTAASGTSCAARAATSRCCATSRPSPRRAGTAAPNTPPRPRA